MGFPVAQLVKNPPQCRRPGLIPGLGRSPGEWKGYPPQYSGLENSMDDTVQSMGSVIHIHAHTYRDLRDLSILKLEIK